MFIKYQFSLLRQSNRGAKSPCGDSANESGRLDLSLIVIIIYESLSMERRSMT